MFFHYYCHESTRNHIHDIRTESAILREQFIMWRERMFRSNWSHHHHFEYVSLSYTIASISYLNVNAFYMVIHPNAVLLTLNIYIYPIFV